MSLSTSRKGSNAFARWSGKPAGEEDGSKIAIRLKCTVRLSGRRKLKAKPQAKSPQSLLCYSSDFLLCCPQRNIASLDCKRHQVWELVGSAGEGGHTHLS